MQFQKGRIRHSGGRGKVSTNPPLRRIHSDQTLTSGSSRFSLDYWRKQPTDVIIKSLQPGSTEALRVKVLEGRDVDVNALPREIVP